MRVGARGYLFGWITDEGISGWGECSDGRSPYGVTGTVRD